jgi:hypothetical protein
MESTELKKIAFTPSLLATLRLISVFPSILLAYIVCEYNKCVCFRSNVPNEQIL